MIAARAVVFFEAAALVWVACWGYFALRCAWFEKWTHWLFLLSYLNLCGLFLSVANQYAVAAVQAVEFVDHVTASVKDTPNV
jgi:hypothetical protein